MNSQHPSALNQLDESSRRLLLTASEKRAPLMLVATATRMAAADALADLLEITHPTHEVLLTHPEAVRWKVTEFVTSIVNPARFAPEEHRHIVVAEAHQATQDVHDRLLKVLEEPFTATTVWLVHDQARPLPNTLRGRAGDQVTVRSAPTHDLVTSLGDTGPHDPGEVLRQASGDLLLATAAAKFDLLDQLRVMGSGYETKHPTMLATQLHLAAAHLAVACHHKVARPPKPPVASSKGTVPVVDQSRLSPQARSTLRRLMEATLDRWYRQALADVVSHDNVSETRVRVQHLEEFRQVRENLAYNTPVMTVLASALALLNAHSL